MSKTVSYTHLGCAFSVETDGLYDVLAVGQDVVCDSPGKPRVTLEYGQTVPYALTDTAFLGSFQSRFDFLKMCIRDRFKTVHKWKVISKLTSSLRQEQVLSLRMRIVVNTYQFLQREESFTLSFFTEEYRGALRICGTKSGRDWIIVP